ncbi:uncharacterized protein LOC125936368 [Panthera uncia]|uniref:vegetative cell wall protein gp1-like n=1 Tax=Panthera leo TaxID=9689 RepID=UPI001C6A448F|nr:vegetative cell wall protein gp1-like [Panthera leo]XP_049506349.1 uncharacterized protein LOC125936368 [Panthera uncia]
MNWRRGVCLSDAGAVRPRRRGLPPPRVWIRVSQAQRSGRDDLNRREWIPGVPQLRGGEYLEVIGRGRGTPFRPGRPAWPLAASSGPARLSSRRPPALTAWARPGLGLSAPPWPPRPGPARAPLSLPFPRPRGPRSVPPLRSLPSGSSFPFSPSLAALCPFPPFLACFRDPASLAASSAQLPPPPASLAPRRHSSLPSWLGEYPAGAPFQLEIPGGHSLGLRSPLPEPPLHPSSDLSPDRV